MGAETQARFRYQHSWAVVLLLGGATKGLPYVAIWCEQHEDLLAEHPDGTYDAFQVKTRQAEDGPWRTMDDGFIRAVRTLTSLHTRFPGRIRNLVFLSNSKCHDTNAEADRRRSPHKLLAAVRQARTPGRIRAPFNSVFKDLASKCEASGRELFASLGKLELKVGLSRAGFDAELAHQHVGQLPSCGHLGPEKLDLIRDELVALVHRASSLVVDDASKHYYCLTSSDARDPFLDRKRIPVERAIQLVDTVARSPFRYGPSQIDLLVDAGTPSVVRFRRKLIESKLESQIEAMEQRYSATEGRLLERIAADPDRARDLLDQLIQFVRLEYAEALLEVDRDAPPYGPALLKRVRERLRRLAQDNPTAIDHEPYETLAGVAGLLTRACELWWGPAFEMEVEP